MCLPLETGFFPGWVGTIGSTIPGSYHPVILSFFETAEPLVTIYLDIILFENVPAQIADGVHLQIAVASLTFPNLDPARCVTIYTGQLVTHAIRFGSCQAGGAG